MAFWNTEDKAQKLITDHFDIVLKGSVHFAEVFNQYLDKECNMDEEMVSLVQIMHTIESDADKKRHEFEAFLYEGNILPNFREDLISLVEKNDKIINKFEALLDFYTLQKMYIHPPLQQGFKEIIKGNHKALKTLSEILSYFFKDFKSARKQLEDVGRIEHDVDTLERMQIIKIFDMNISLSEKVLLREFTNIIADVSDLAENTADMIETFIIKRIF